MTSWDIQAAWESIKAWFMYVYNFILRKEEPVEEEPYLKLNKEDAYEVWRHLYFTNNKEQDESGNKSTSTME